MDFIHYRVEAECPKLYRGFPNRLNNMIWDYFKLRKWHGREGSPFFVCTRVILILTGIKYVWKLRRASLV